MPPDRARRRHHGHRRRRARHPGHRRRARLPRAAPRARHRPAERARPPHRARSRRRASASSARTRRSAPRCSSAAAPARRCVTVRRDGQTDRAPATVAHRRSRSRSRCASSMAARTSSSSRPRRLPDELTHGNNRAVVAIEGIREKLRVLLVSGEPHAGERTWRNLLKSDANVDLVHFTILRPPEKQDGTPINELSLIAFPTRELFQQKIKEFDLIIFDRYANQSVLPLDLFRQHRALCARRRRGAGRGRPGIRRRREPLAHAASRRSFPARRRAHRRGALSGPHHRHRRSATRSPATCRARSRTRRPGASGSASSARRSQAGTALMSGAGDRPLLVLAREEKGRVALLLSDHAWLWARGYREGGPHLDLLRRLAHWLMKEPELEEEALRASVARPRHPHRAPDHGATAPTPVTLTGPSGARAHRRAQPRSSPACSRAQRREPRARPAHAALGRPRRLRRASARRTRASSPTCSATPSRCAPSPRRPAARCAASPRTSGQRRHRAAHLAGALRRRASPAATGSASGPSDSAIVRGVSVLPAGARPPRPRRSSSAPPSRPGSRKGGGRLTEPSHAADSPALAASAAAAAGSAENAGRAAHAAAGGRGLTSPRRRQHPGTSSSARKRAGRPGPAARAGAAGRA